LIPLSKIYSYIGKVACSVGAHSVAPTKHRESISKEFKLIFIPQSIIMTASMKAIIPNKYTQLLSLRHVSLGYSEVSPAHFLIMMNKLSQ
jgi:hypothetical protein